MARAAAVAARSMAGSYWTSRDPSAYPLPVPFRDFQRELLLPPVPILFASDGAATIYF